MQNFFFCFLCVIIFVYAHKKLSVHSCAWSPKDNLKCCSIEATLGFLTGSLPNLELVKSTELRGWPV